MKITIKDFAPIAEASIALDGLTVIAGENDTGKSTVGRLLFSLIKSAKWEGEDYKSEHLPAGAFLIQVFGSDSRRGHIGLEFKGKLEEFEVEITPEKVTTHFSSAEWGHYGADIDTLLIETPLVWQLFDVFQSIAAQTYQNMFISSDGVTIKAPFTYFDVYTRLNGSVKPRKSELVKQLASIESTMQGRIVFKNNSPVFERGNDSFPMESVATGIQSFGFMQRILELGLARPGMYLILDEPEVHLHPKWQLEYAKLLVNMVHDLGMSVLLTSHSAVFVETLEFVGKKKLGERCKFYLSERNDDQSVTMRDVSDDLEPIYEKLAHPLMQLSMFQGDA